MISINWLNNAEHPAPKDGTRFLVWLGEDEGASECCWNSKTKRWELSIEIDGPREDYMFTNAYWYWVPVNAAPDGIDDMMEEKE